MAEYRLNQGSGTVVSDDNPLPVEGEMTGPSGAELATEDTLGDAAASLAIAVTHLAALETAAEDTSPVNTYPLPTTPVSGATAAMTGTTSTQLLAAPGASLRNYVTAIIVSNAHATVDTEIEILDGNGGTVLMTIPAPADYGGAVISLPTPLKQPTANTRLDAKCTVTGSSTKVSAVGYSAA